MTYVRSKPGTPSWWRKRFESFLAWKCNDCGQTLLNHINYTTCLFNPGSTFVNKLDITHERLLTGLQHTYSQMDPADQQKYADFAPVGRQYAYPKKLHCPKCKKLVPTQVELYISINLKIRKHYHPKTRKLCGKSGHAYYGKGWAP